VSDTPVSELAWGTLGSPVGQLSVACSAAGLAQVCFGPPPARATRAARPDPGSSWRKDRQNGRDQDEDRGYAGQERRPAAARARAGEASAQPEGTDGGPAAAQRQLGRACTQLGEYFAGQRRAFDLPVDWSGMSAAQRQVLAVLLASAAYGETVTYGALARRAGLADGGQVPAARVGYPAAQSPQGCRTVDQPYQWPGNGGREPALWACDQHPL